MTYRTSGPPPFKPVVGERIILIDEGFAPHSMVSANIEVRRGKETLTISEVSPKVSRWMDYSPHTHAQFIVARTYAGRGVYISAYHLGTQIVWLDRTSKGAMKTMTDVLDWEITESQSPLNIKETDKLFTTRTQETKAGIVGQVVFESDVVWESEPIPRGEYDDDHDLYPGIRDAEKAAYAAKKMAVANLFNNV